MGNMIASMPRMNRQTTATLLAIIAVIIGDNEIGWCLVMVWFSFSFFKTQSTYRSFKVGFFLQFFHISFNLVSYRSTRGFALHDVFFLVLFIPHIFAWFLLIFLLCDFFFKYKYSRLCDHIRVNYRKGVSLGAHNADDCLLYTICNEWYAFVFL